MIVKVVFINNYAVALIRTILRFCGSAAPQIGLRRGGTSRRIAKKQVLTASGA
jgi:hypothetical protein